MKFYIGKFSNQYFNQIDNKFYQCNNDNKLNGLAVADYVFLSPQTYKDKYIRLWKVVEITYDTKRLEVNSANDMVKVLFEEILDYTFDNIEQLMNFKHFDLNKDLIVNCHMGTKNSFFPLTVEKDFDQSQFFNNDFYSLDNSRKIKIIKENQIQEERYDFQILEENNVLKCIEPVFGQMPGIFKDNRTNIGRGSSKKDRSLVQFNILFKENEVIRFEDFSIYSFYFCFYCEYNEKVNYWIFQGNPDIYDVKSALSNSELKSWSVKAHKDKIKTGDKFILWLTGKESGCYAVGEVISEIENFKDEEDSKYYKNSEQNTESERVNILIEEQYVNNPILWNNIKENSIFKSFKGGNQGTNFSSNKEQYEYFINENTSSKIRYWLYAPGENASMWEEFYSLNIMGLGFEEIGDLNQYSSKDEIQSKFQEIENTSGNKMNDTSANYQFKFEIKIGDIIIVKRGRSEYLGYGVVESDYYFDESKDNFKKCRKVKWKKKGQWKEERKDIVLKTLTDITKYPEYVQKLIDLIGIEKQKEKIDMKISHPLNQILFGAPGTGKTYKTKKLAVEIIDNKAYTDRTEINERYEELKSTNQIHFTTFHQSMSYEDFIEGIKPVLDNEDSSDVQYEIKNGIFKELSEHASKEIKNQNKLKETTSLNFEDAWDSLIEKSNQAFELNKHYSLNTITGKEIDIIGITNKGNLIVKPRLENTLNYAVSFNRAKKLFEKYPDLKLVKNIEYEFRMAIGGSFSTGYWSVLNYIINWISENATKAEISNEISEQKKYVLIIDEINRGNVSAIFGELITLIEDDKRKGILSPKSETIEVTLPYSKDKFSVPDNLYIIGTMNTADRSVEALDTALRRRFSFTEMQPNAELLASISFRDVDLKLLLENINRRIELLIDKNHQIGHAYFIEINSLEDLTQTFKNKIIPLLEEYFYGDYGKIGLVLGDLFIKEVGLKTEFAKFDYEDKDLLKEKKIWEFTDSKSWTVDTFKSIYE